MNHLPFFSRRLRCESEVPAQSRLARCRRILASLCLLLAAGGTPAACAASNDLDLAWPAVTRQARPWTYWWWMGSAVDRTNLTRELQRYHDAGLGGVHIIPIYGAKGFEDKYLSYLSRDWMDMLRHTVSEAARLDMGVDMTTGSGWCFGGPNVRESEANAAVQWKEFDVPAGARLPAQPAKIQALVAYAPGGKPVDLTARVRPDGTVDWISDGSNKVYAVWQKPSGQKVKRPAPGGEGPMLNLIYPPAVAHFLERFTDAFEHYTGPKPRAQYHDSYEYRSDWAPDFFQQFEKRRGYRLQDELPALFAKAAGEHTARVRCDYRETVSDIMSGESLPLWVGWSHEHGFMTRNEAHGSPANLLDLYAAADIPETEMFNKDRNKLVSKFASSAAHVAGHRLVGSETGTWLKEHFTETLGDVKYLVDDVLLSGVNHIFYHGTCYSPDEAGWPGWVFYASTEMNPRNAIWHDAPAINAYIARCQSILQEGEPDNDLLLYWPIHDFWQSAAGLLPHLTVHARAWLEDQPVGKAAERLWNRGYAFDYVSDRQLAASKATVNGVSTAGAHYQSIVVPACTLMPPATFQRLLALADGGATIVFQDHLPADVPGWSTLSSRRAELRALAGGLGLKASRGAFAGVREAAHGKGRIFVGPLEESLAAAGAKRESMVDHPGLWFIRRSFAGGRHYFIANRGERTLAGWVPLSVAAKSAALLDPMTGASGIAAFRAGDPASVFLQLEPGESIIVRAFDQRDSAGAPWKYGTPGSIAAPLDGPWQIEFVSGGPILPKGGLAKPGSWTALDDPEAQRFAGTARYTTHFDAPSSLHGEGFIDLGTVAQSARVRLNGRDLGMLIVPPFRVRAANLKESGNLLEVEVTNVSANRLRDLDRRGVSWRNFHDINFVNMDYKPFDASKWPLYDSGLLGPVTLRAAAPALP